MTRDERLIARLMLKSRIVLADGQAFEDLFTEVLGYAHREFIPVRPYGDAGDRKNDGYRRDTGHYYQVFAPHDLRSTVVTAIKKLETDFAGLKDHWHSSHPIRAFQFVMNDRFRGSPADVELALLRIRTASGLPVCGSYLTKHLEDDTFSLADDQIVLIVGSIPDPTKIESIGYSVLHEVIAEVLGKQQDFDYKLVMIAPRFEEKIQFNGLGRAAAELLRVAGYQVGHVDAYFARNSAFAKQTLRDRLSGIYSQLSSPVSAEGAVVSADDVFFEMLRQTTPDGRKTIQDAALVVIAYFFEACDVFESPEPRLG